MAGKIGNAGARGEVGGGLPAPAACTGLRITPNVYTTLGEIDTFIEGFEQVVKQGLPSE
jgi:hypothetical protein